MGTAFVMEIVRWAECLWLLLRFKNTTNNNACHSSSSSSSSSLFFQLQEVEKCRVGDGYETVACDLEGTLLRSKCQFPYLMLMALEAGSPVRALLLLLTWPLAWLLRLLRLEEWCLRVMIFVTFAGLRVDEVEIVSRAVLPKFYLEDLHVHSFRAFMAAKTKWVVSESPRVMIQGFLSHYLCIDVQNVVATELHHTSNGSRYTGLVRTSGLVLGMNKLHSLTQALAGAVPDLGIGDSVSDFPFLSFCKEAYRVSKRKVEAVPREEYPRALVFHDGRLVRRPTPLEVLLLLLWLPLGTCLAFSRMLVGICLPPNWAVPAGSLLGVRTRVRGDPPLPNDSQTKIEGAQGCRGAGAGGRGVVYVCTHRTLFDPVFVATALGRPVTAVTYSLSNVTEWLAPIRTVPLRRSRDDDAATMRRVLAHDGALVVCPEGTTCREPFLLRFSPLFAELSDSAGTDADIDIAPVAADVDTTAALFHGSTARGHKSLDPLFFLLNPRPCYRIHFLGRLPRHATCAAGLPAHEVANYVQRVLAQALGFHCTSLTRRHKYGLLAANDGRVRSKSPCPHRRFPSCALSNLFFK